MAPGEVADGYLTAGNMYDGYMYVFGRGLSSTTISGPQIAISSGQSLVLTGTVLDQSPAEQGKACVSAQSMPTYMEYLHMGLPIDGVGHNITVIGVPVSFDTLDPNGNYQHIATVTSDASGAYGYTWTPTTTGQYEVTATFAGDNSYGSSWASTYVAVTTASTTSPTATTVPITVDAITNSMMSLIIGGVIAIIIAIAIVGIVLYKKH